LKGGDDGDGWEEEEFAEVESVLGQSKRSGTFRSLPLTWHYRSRHENLIAFSNHRFYGGRLITFPSASETAPDLGVESFSVPGVYRRGTSRDNAIEAQAVVDRVFIHAETGQRSIGVVAFSEAQASLIEAMLQRDSRYGDPEFADLMSADRLEGLFIKNLENVQGDEREVIIFSVGYGPDEHGKMTMGLGPIINEGGWRRLNVAVTRARSRVEIVSSFGPEALAESANPGIDALRRYMEFAEHGPSVLAVADGTDASGLAESPFEESVIAVLQGWGHDVAAQVGTAGYRIDMAIRDPRNRGRFVLGIECDGAMYHSSRVARDRDRLREEVLVGLGWTLHRIWGPSWYRDRPGEERRLKDAIQAAMTSEPASSALATQNFAASRAPRRRSLPGRGRLSAAAVRIASRSWEESVPAR
jgi:very-short-patch-repair endonuclease